MSGKREGKLGVQFILGSLQGREHGGDGRLVGFGEVRERWVPQAIVTYL